MKGPALDLVGSDVLEACRGRDGVAWRLRVLDKRLGGRRSAALHPCQRKASFTKHVRNAASRVQDVLMLTSWYCP